MSDVTGQHLNLTGLITKRRVLEFVLACLGVVVGLLFIRFFFVSANVPGEVNYQGKLTDINGVNVADGSYDFQVRIYDHATNDLDANLLFTDTLSGVSVQNGIFNLRFTPGASVLSGSGDRYLQVCFDSNATGSDAVVGCGTTATSTGDTAFDKRFLPRKLLTANPFAVISKYLGSNLVAGDDGSDAGAITFTGTTGVGLSPASSGRIYFDSGTNKFRCSENGAAYVDCISSASGTLTGGGTATRVAFWDGASSLSSSANLYWDNTNSRLGIGVTSPSTALQIDGDSPTITLKNTYLSTQQWQTRVRSVLSSGSLGYEIYNSTSSKTGLLIKTDGDTLLGTDTNYGGLGNNSRLFVYGGDGGANVDVMGEAVFGRDQAVIDLQSSDFDTTTSSLYAQFYGPLGSSTSMGYDNQYLGQIVFQDANTALIRTTNTTPIIFGIDDIERLRITENGIDVSGNMIIRGTAAPSLSNSGEGKIYFDSTSNKFQCSENGGAYVDCISSATGTLTGSGTATQVAFWDSGSSLTSSADLYWDNTNTRLGIGTATPGVTLDVAGIVNATTQYNLNGSRFAYGDSGSSNTFIGFNSGVNNVSGFSNVLIGDYTGQFITNSGTNTFVGAYAGNLSTGNSNTFMGTEAGYYIETGYDNVAIGTYSGSEETTQSVMIGRGSSVSTGVNNAIALGTGATASASNQFIVGSTYQGTNYINDMVIVSTGLNLRVSDTGVADTDGPDFNISAGRSRGTGLGGSLIFNTAPDGAAGSTINNALTRLTIDGLGAFEYGAASGSPSVSSAGTGKMYYDSGLNKFQCSENGGAYVDCISSATGNVSGTGTASRIAYWTAADTIGSTSAELNSSGQIGLGGGGIDPTVFGGATSTQLTINKTYTSIPAIRTTGQLNNLVLNPSANITNRLYGTYNYLEAQSANDIANTTAYGGAVEYNGTGTLNYGGGMNVFVDNNNNGTINTATGLYGSVYNYGTGTVGTAYGFGAYVYNEGTITTNSYAGNSLIENYGTTPLMNGFFGTADNYGTSTYTTGVYGQARTLGTGSTTVQYGVYAQGALNTTSNITSNSGLYAETVNDSINTVTTNAAGVFFTSNNSSATITNNYGVRIDTPNNNGTLANNYGLYINNQTVSGATTAYNFYSAGTGSTNYFEGSILFGGPTSAPSLSGANQGRIYYDNTADKFKCSENGGSYFNCFSSSSVSGSGTATQVAFWNGSSTLTSTSNLYWDNTNTRLGIGTSSPDLNLDIESASTAYTAIELTNTDTTTRRWVLLSGGNTASFAPSKGFGIRDLSGSVTPFTISTAGNVGIGTAATAASLRLHVYDDQNTTTGILVQNPNTGSSAYAGIRLGNNSDQVSGIYRNSSTNTGYGGANSLNIITLNPNPIALITGNQVRFTVDGSGNTTMGANTVSATTTMDIGGTGTTFAVCHIGVAASTNDVGIVDCTGTPAADYMEMYPMENGINTGDVVALSTNFVVNKEGVKVNKLKKASANDATLFGIASDPANAGDFNSIGHNINDADNPYPVALNGRVPVKIDPSTDPIEAGDYLTASVNIPGRAVKANSGFVIGKAMEKYTGQDTIMVYVTNTYYNPTTSTTAATVTNNDWTNISGVLTTNNDVKINGSLAVTGNVAVNGILTAFQATIKDLTIDKLTVNPNPTDGESTIGNGTIPAGQITLDIANTNVTANSKILITGTSGQGVTIDVVEKTTGVGFTVKIPSASTSDITFDYWIVGVE